MGFKQVQTLDADNVIALGGTNKKTNKSNPKVVEGYYIGSRKVESRKAKKGYAYIHILQTEDGNLGVWGKTDLDNKLLQVTPGTMIRATFTGTKPTPNGPMYVYRVEQDTDQTVEVDASLAESTEASEDSGEAEASDEYEGSEPADLSEEEEVTEEQQAPVARSAAQRRAETKALLSKPRSK